VLDVNRLTHLEACRILGIRYTRRRYRRSSNVHSLEKVNAQYISPKVSPVTHTRTLPDYHSRFAIEVVTFARSGNFINLSHIDPTILYLRKVGNKGSSQYLTDFAGTAYMCLTSGRCVRSHLVDLQLAPTTPGSAQNYRKSIDVSPHTVEFERMAGVIGMAAH
jgi:hypothetical protein